MLEVFTEMFSYPFLVRAFAAGLAVALAAGLLGVSLVLKRFSMIGDGLSHVSFGCLAVAAALNWAPLAVTLPVVSVAAFLLLKLNDNRRINGDAAIALISCASLAMGVIAVSLTTGMSVDVYNYMFGSILSVSRTDMILCLTVSSAVITVFVLLFNRVFAVTFDESFSKATGQKTGLYDTVLALLTAVTIVTGMKLVGALLISGLIIFPPLAAMRVAKTFRAVTLISAAISIVCFFVGLTASYVFDIPAGACVIAANTAAFFVLYIWGKTAAALPKR